MGTIQQPMKLVRISLAFKRLSAVLLAVFGQAVYTAVNGNTSFPAPYPALLLLQNAVNDLISKIALQQPGNKASTSAVKDAVVELNRILKALAGYVEFESNRNQTMALTSGFSILLGRMAKATVFTALQGLQSGSVDVNSPVGGKSYIWGYTTDPVGSTAWLVAATTTQAYYTINGLAPGTKYWFRVALVTPDGQQDWSTPIMVHVV